MTALSASNSYTYMNHASEAQVCQHVSAELRYCPLPIALLSFQAYHGEDMRLLAQHKCMLVLILA